VTSGVAIAMAAEPASAEHAMLPLDTTSSTPASVEHDSAEADPIPVVAYEANNVLLTTSNDSFPFNWQFDSQDTAAGFGLSYDANQGDEFNAIDVSQGLDIDELFNATFAAAANQYDFEGDQFDFDVNQCSLDSSQYQVDAYTLYDNTAAQYGNGV
jgi:hypothetical protein